MADLKELKRHYQNGNLLPFVGAGVSVSVEWEDGDRTRRGLSWDKFVDQAADQLGFRPELLRMRGDSLQILEYYRIRRSGLGSLINWLMTEMRAPDDALLASSVHAELAQMQECSVFYTTNYDDYLERAFQLHGRAVKRIALEDHMGSARGATEVVKFHGDFDWPDKMVVSESDYLERLAFNSPMDWKLRSDLLGRAVLFLGYSFRDSNVAYLFHRVNELFERLPLSGSGRRAFIVIPDPSDFEESLFQRRNIEVIPVSRQSMSDDIAEILQELRS